MASSNSLRLARQKNAFPIVSGSGLVWSRSLMEFILSVSVEGFVMTNYLTGHFEPAAREIFL